MTAQIDNHPTIASTFEGSDRLATITISRPSSQPVMVFGADGKIYHNGKLITTDRELVAAVKRVFQGGELCPTQKEKP